ncbi:hypothetical protein M9H77_01641 [Catharanthus roseus]|uniref:Uncharacterized protein n=1 Tax=Catharanthus roseus TaxID=4058 RepID=A0ACC0C6H8_CATRO|nr:hypothetical protein M9H77_01641 [Catharanthus roseus]
MKKYLEKWKKSSNPMSDGFGGIITAFRCFDASIVILGLLVLLDYYLSSLATQLLGGHGSIVCGGFGCDDGLCTCRCPSYVVLALKLRLSSFKICAKLRFFNRPISCIIGGLGKRNSDKSENTYLIVTRYLRSRISDRRPYVTLACEHGGAKKSRTKVKVDDKEKVPIKSLVFLGFRVFFIYKTVQYDILEAIRMTTTGNNFTVATEFMQNEESGLMPVVDEVFNRSYHMLCKRHIDQNVLAKSTEMIKDEEVASQFINGTWHKLLNEIDEA